MPDQVKERAPRKCRERMASIGEAGEGDADEDEGRDIGPAAPGLQAEQGRDRSRGHGREPYGKGESEEPAGRAARAFQDPEIGEGGGAHDGQE